MGDLTINPVAQTGANLHSGGVSFTAEAGVAVTKDVKKGGFEAMFSIVPSVSLTDTDKRATGSFMVTGMLTWPVLTSIGPRVSYNFDQKETEVGAMACAQTLIPISSSNGFFGGLCFTANDLSHVKSDGISGLLTFTGQL